MEYTRRDKLKIDHQRILFVLLRPHCSGNMSLTVGTTRTMTDLNFQGSCCNGKLVQVECFHFSDRKEIGDAANVAWFTIHPEAPSRKLCCDYCTETFCAVSIAHIASSKWKLNTLKKVRHRDFRSVFVQSPYETATRFLIYLQSCNSKVPLFSRQLKCNRRASCLAKTNAELKLVINLQSTVPVHSRKPALFSMCVQCIVSDLTPHPLSVLVWTARKIRWRRQFPLRNHDKRTAGENVLFLRRTESRQRQENWRETSV